MSRPRAFFAPLMIGVIAVSAFLCVGCEEKVGLIEPPPLFTFEPADAWPTNCSADAKSAGTEEGARPAGGETEKVSGPQSVPPPPGLFISACPNPAPPEAPEIVIEFRLDVVVSGVNLAIVNSRGEIIRVLMRDQRVERDRLVQATWLLDGVPPGDYRAYFRAGTLESFGDLKVE